MGKVMSIVSRKANRFNAENRAQRYLDKKIITPAPKFEASYEDMRRTLVDDPEFLERANKRDKELDNRLRDVFVTSEEGLIRKSTQEINKTLPLDRSAVDDFEYGFKEPIRVSIGRCTLRQAMKFIADYQENPSVHNTSKIANDYKLKPDRVEKILTYFKTFQIHIPDSTLKERILQKSEVKSIDEKKDET